MENSKWWYIVIDNFSKSIVGGFDSSDLAEKYVDFRNREDLKNKIHQLKLNYSVNMNDCERESLFFEIQTYESILKYQKIIKYYPVNDKENTEMYLKYKAEADKLENIHFGGRLAEYKYYDMHQVISSALNFIKKTSN